MIRTIARRGTVTLVMAGVAAFGAVALAPAASASLDVDGSMVVVDLGPGNGPDDFLVTDTGRTPVFFCDPSAPKKRHSICIADPSAGGPRF